MPSSVKPHSKNLVFCVHAHQPVGNFNHVFSDAYEKSYRPFFEVLEAHPSVAASCHLSGSLIDWLEEYQPAFLGKLKRLSDRGQVEWMGGAYYEPIYGVISKADLAGQIGLMREKLKMLFGVEPQGAWLAERVWDPDLVKPLTDEGLSYTVLDDSHFQKAGVKPPVCGYYRAKGPGSPAQKLRRTNPSERLADPPLDFFASMKQLRYLMPFRRPEETLEFIHATPASPEDVFVFADDCEKFGMWPGTFHWVYQEKWLDKLFTLLEKDPGIATHTFGAFRKQFSSKRAIRVPHGSYAEMMEWSGGSFYRFFDKYDESRYMRDRMRLASAELAKTNGHNGSSFAGAKGAPDESIPPKAGGLAEAKISLYRAQCNCPYWHGVFGGLYLHHLRSAVFENLISVDRYLLNGRGANRSRHGAEFRLAEFDSGSRWKIRQKNIVSFFNPRYGAALEELDFLPKSVNLMCNLRRYKEPYHDVVFSGAGRKDAAFSIHALLGAKEPDLERHLHYDAFRRLSFMDHFFEAETDLQSFATSSYRDVGDFAAEAYRKKRPLAGKVSLTFERKGRLELGARRFPLRVSKMIVPHKDAGLSARYVLHNDSPRDLSCVFGVEFNFSIGDAAAMAGLDKKNVSVWTFHDAWRLLAIRLSAKPGMNLLAAPIETVSESEAGLEKTYQQLGVLLQSGVVLPARRSRAFTLGLEVRTDWTGS